MTQRFSQDAALAALPRLTRTRLTAFIAEDVIRPTPSDTGPVFAHIDIARLHLLCDLTDTLELDDEAASLVIALIDQLHSARADLMTLLRAIDAQPHDIRTQLGAAIARLRRSP